MSNSKKKHKGSHKLTENQVIELVESQPQEVQDEIADKIIAGKIESYSGPIPHPSLLKDLMILSQTVPTAL